MRVATLLFVLFATCRVAVVGGLGFRHEVLIQSSNSRLLQQAQSANCTPARTLNDTWKPFCFVPDTVSPEAKQFLSQAAAGNSPFGQPSFGTTPAEQAALVGRQRAFVASLIATGSAPTATNDLQSVRNATIANVPVVIAVPKSVNETSPANTKVLMYVHGELQLAGAAWAVKKQRACIQCIMHSECTVDATLVASQWQDHELMPCHGRACCSTARLVGLAECPCLHVSACRR